MNHSSAPRVIAADEHGWRQFLADFGAASELFKAGTPAPRAAAMPWGVGAPMGGRVAEIPIVGTLLPTVPEWMRDYGIRVTGYDEIEAAVRKAVADARVEEIVLNVDSPGGMVRGVMGAARAVREAADSKPVTVWCDGMCSSAAYWVCCGASRFLVGPTAYIGSIGVYQVWYDNSGANARYGFRPVVIRSGAHKGMGIDGITDEQIAAEQENVDAIAELFKGAVADGRGLGIEQLEALATGQTWVGARAVTVGLADRVLETYTVGQIVDDEEEITMSKSEERVPVVTETPVDISAQIADAVAAAVSAERDRCAGLVAAFGGLDLGFCAEHIGAGTDQTAAKAAAFDAGIGVKPATPAETPAAPAVALNVDGKHEGAEPVASAEPKPTTMQTRVAALQAQNPGMTFEGAVSRIAKEDPNYYAAFCRGEVA